MNIAELIASTPGVPRVIYRLGISLGVGSNGGIKELVIRSSTGAGEEVFRKLCSLACEVRLTGKGWIGEFSRDFYGSLAAVLERSISARGRVRLLHKCLEIPDAFRFFIGSFRETNSFVPVLRFECEQLREVWDALRALQLRGVPAPQRQPMYRLAEKQAELCAIEGSGAVIFDGETLLHYFPRMHLADFVNGAGL